MHCSASLPAPDVWPRQRSRSRGNLHSLAFASAAACALSQHAGGRHLTYLHSADLQTPLTRGKHAADAHRGCLVNFSRASTSLIEAPETRGEAPSESDWGCFRAVPSAAVQGRHSECIIFLKGAHVFVRCRRRGCAMAQWPIQVWVPSPLPSSLPPFPFLPFLFLPFPIPRSGAMKSIAT